MRAGLNHGIGKSRGISRGHESSGDTRFDQISKTAGCGTDHRHGLGKGVEK
jgi:hypothetical protein